MFTKRARYGVALTFEAPVLLTDGSFATIGTDWTPAAGDVKISKDGGNVANIGTLPTLLGGTGSKTGVWTLSAAEMEAQRVVIQVSDAALQDDFFVIETLPDGAIATGKASAGGTNTITVATGLAIVPGAVVHIHGGTGAGQALVVNGYVSGTGVATMENNWATQPDNTSLYTVWAGPIAPETSLTPVNVKAWADDAVPAPTVTGRPLVDVTHVDGVVADIATGVAVAAVQVKTDNLPDDPADQSLIIAATDAIVSLLGATPTEPAAVPAFNAALSQRVNYILARLINKQTFNKDTGAFALRNAADNANIATRTDSNNGTTYTKGGGA